MSLFIKNIYYNKISQGKPKFDEPNGLQTTIIFTPVLHNELLSEKSQGNTL